MAEQNDYQEQFFPNNKPSLLQLILRYKLIIIAGIILLLFIILFLVSFLSMNNIAGPSTIPTPTPVNTAEQGRPRIQLPFKVIKTEPQNNASDVLAGEIQINISTDVPIISPNSFSLTLTPSLTYPLQYNNSYPTKEIRAYNLDSLKPNTTYQATLKNKDGKEVYAWTFSTTSQRGQSESALRVHLDNEILKTYYPLLSSLPFESATYALKYAERLTLKITLKNAQTDKASVLEEVKAWVKSKGIDPNTHKYIFAN